MRNWVALLVVLALALVLVAPSMAATEIVRGRSAVNGRVVSSTYPLAITTTEIVYTDALDLATKTVTEVSVFVNPASIASGGTLTMMLQKGMKDMAGNWVWANYAQLSAVDKGEYTTAAAADKLQYQKQYVSYVMPAASRAIVTLKFVDWDPAFALRMKFSGDGSHAISIQQCDWLLK